MKTVLITTDNRFKVVSVDPGARSFDEFRRITGQGWAEFVNPRDWDEVIVCDEEGLLKGLEVNEFASLCYGSAFHGHPIVGDVILMKAVIGPDGPDYAFYKDSEVPKLMKALTLRLILFKKAFGIDSKKYKFIEEE